MYTTAEIYEMLLQKAVARSITAQADYGATLNALQAGVAWMTGLPKGGWYDYDDEYVSFMLAGDLAGDKPVGP